MTGFKSAQQAIWKQDCNISGMFLRMHKMVLWEVCENYMH